LSAKLRQDGQVSIVSPGPPAVQDPILALAEVAMAGQPKEEGKPATENDIRTRPEMHRSLLTGCTGIIATYRVQEQDIPDEPCPRCRSVGWCHPGIFTHSGDDGGPST
jgi:hypothetical protein